MTAFTLLQDLHAKDIRLAIQGEFLAYDAPAGALAAAVLDVMRQHKVALVALRHAEEEHFQERTALLEYDAGLTVEEAERLARQTSTRGLPSTAVPAHAGPLLGVWAEGGLSAAGGPWGPAWWQCPCGMRVEDEAPAIRAPRAHGRNPLSPLLCCRPAVYGTWERSACGAAGLSAL